MSSDAWGQFAPRVERALGGSKCEIGYTTGFALADGVLTRAIDDYTRANGPTDDLLAQLTPAARGDLIMVLIVAGQLPTPVKVSLADDARSGASLRPERRGYAGTGAARPTLTFSRYRHRSIRLRNTTPSLLSVCSTRAATSPYETVLQRRVARSYPRLAAPDRARRSGPRRIDHRSRRLSHRPRPAPRLRRRSRGPPHANRVQAAYDPDAQRGAHHDASPAPGDHMGTGTASGWREPIPACVHGPPSPQAGARRGSSALSPDRAWRWISTPRCVAAAPSVAELSDLAGAGAPKSLLLHAPSLKRSF